MGARGETPAPSAPASPASGAGPAAGDSRGRLLAVLVLLPAIFGAARTLYVLLARSTYPYHLDHLESDLFSQAVVFQRGGALYDDPASGFLWWFYGPVHTAVLAAVFSVVGSSLPAARAVSTLSTLGTAFFLGWWVRRSSGDRVGAFLAGGLFLALFAASGCWYDAARVDSLAVFLAVAGAFCLHAGDAASWKRRLAGCVLLLAAVYTKQNLLLFALGALALAPLPFPSRLLTLGGWILALLALGKGLALATEGRFLTYVVALPALFPLLLGQWPRFFEVLSRPPIVAIPLGFVPMLLALALGRSARRATAIPIGRVCGLFLAAFAASALGLFKAGGLFNNLMPAAAFGALGVGLTFAAVRRPGWPLVVRLGTFATTVVLPFASLFFSVKDQIPTREDRENGDAIVSYLRGFPGRFWVLDFNYLHILVGRQPPPTALSMAAMAGKLRIEREERKALLRGEIDLVLADEHQAYEFLSPLLVAYERYPEMRSLPVDLRARLGPPTGLSTVWVPKNRRVALPPFPAPPRPR